MASAWSERGGTRRAGELRRFVLARDNYVCWLCGLPGADSADHVVPRAQGGDDRLTNLRAAHLRCNISRGTKAVESPTPSREW